MNDSVKFKRIQELAATVFAGLDELSLGNLSKEELEMLTDHSRELYERLVVLRFKAYDNEVKGTAVPVVESQPEEPQPISFKFHTSPAAEAKPEVAPNQVSLIDAIEEVTKAEEPVLPELKAEEHISEESFEMNVGATQPVVPPAYTTQPQESLNDRLAKSVTQAPSVAQKHEHTPIADLKRAITLNQRFQFSKELFKGNNQDYEVAIDRLNNTNRDEAFRQLEQLRSKYAWNNESQITQDFVELVERRHQA
jgi:hypothetical protein